MKKNGRNGRIPGVVLVLTTLPGRRAAKALASALVEAKLAACATLVPGWESHYVWEGRLEKTPEVALWVKTTPRARPAVFRMIRDLHPYKVPEILSWKADAVDGDYGCWVAASVLPGRALGAL